MAGGRVFLLTGCDNDKLWDEAVLFAAEPEWQQST
jgi:hypothetical protein